MKRPELLAPAGSFESLKAAVEAGCDAVYLSGKLYGARSFAANFSNEELIEAFNYCHSYGVKVYVTVNTLIYEDEVNNFIKYIDFLYTSGVDAIIIQDIGMFDLIRKTYPKLEIHISTQMHIHNLEGTKLMEELGASRVVLARETPIELVENIKKNTNIELEIFIHGALCISYSGQCLMSSLIGGRSGNRGTCAQCCRQPYSLYCNNEKIKDNDYILSTRDLNTLDNIGRLIDIGVDSLKIEGRLKRPEYVYLVVSTYRRAIDNYIKYKETKITEEDILELKKIFNRKFTKGFLFNTKNDEFINSYRPNHQGINIGKVIDIKNHLVFIKLNDFINVQDGIRCIGLNDVGMTIQTMKVNNKRVERANKGDIVCIDMKELPAFGDIVVKTTDHLQLKDIENKINSGNRKIPVSISIDAHLNNKIVLTINDNISIISDYIVDESKNYPTTKDSIIKQLSKLGNTVYEIDTIDINMDDNIFIPVKVLNNLRRDIIDKLNESRKKKILYTKSEYSIDVKDYEHEKKLVLYLSDNKKIDLSKYDEIIVDDINFIEDNNYRLKLSRVNEQLNEFNNKKLLIGELGSLYKYRNNNNLCSDFSFNVTNSYSVAFLHSLGVDKVTLSYELNDYQIEKIIKKYHERYNKHPNIELIVSDIPEAMILKYDIFNGNYDKNNKYYIKDKFNNKFDVKRKNNLTIIYNFKPINKEQIDKYYELGINSLRINSIIL